MARPIGTTRVKKPITKFEFDKLIHFVGRTNHIHHSGLRERLRRAFTLLFITGCRVSEIMNFTSDDVRKMILEKEFSLANNTKTKSSRLITYADGQLELLRNILPVGQVRLFGDVSLEYFNIKMNKIIHLCLGELYSSHSFRSGYITRLALNGENIKLIQEDIGHRSIQTTARYIKITSEDKRTAKSKLEW